MFIYNCLFKHLPVNLQVWVKVIKLGEFWDKGEKMLTQLFDKFLLF